MSTVFVKVAALGDIAPGKMACVDADGSRILLANVDGEILAVDDMCTHEDASLSTGCLKGEYVKCPLHGSRFNLRNGEAMEEPAEDPLRTYPVKIEGDDILVSLG
jgi:3-phenylpropionate/trans-cinnamate dioxygenase ferredoxin subunit